MKSLWLLFLPLVFLPSYGLGGPTPLGVVELSDYLIVPLVVVTWLASRRRGRLLMDELMVPLAIFIGWSLFTTLLIRERYGYPTDREILIGCTKLGRFTLYASAGLLAARALVDSRQNLMFIRSLLASALVLAVSLSQFSGRDYSVREARAVEGYKANNGISVLVAMFLCYFGGLWLSRWGTPRWRAVLLSAMAVMIAGFLLSEGRGGWVGGIAGATYLLYRRGLRARTLAGLAAGVISIAIAYQALPTFRKSVDLTIEPDPQYLASSVQLIPGLDDGDRLYIWSLEAAKFVSSPLLGTGFFHRGGASGLFSAGSHNFFLQIALETGVVGGASLIMIFGRMWRHAGTRAARSAGQEVPFRAALIAAVVGAMSGEYFYGSTPLLGLFLLYAPVGALPRPDHKGHRHEDLDRG